VSVHEKVHALSFLIPIFIHKYKETPLHVGIDIQKLLKLEGKTCLLGTNCDKDHPLLKPQLLWQSHEKEQPAKPNQLEWGR
jgi:hypothetical protein